MERRIWRLMVEHMEAKGLEIMHCVWKSALRSLGICVVPNAAQLVKRWL